MTLPVQSIRSLAAALPGFVPAQPVVRAPARRPPAIEMVPAFALDRSAAARSAAKMWVDFSCSKQGLEILPTLSQLRQGDLRGCDAACGYSTEALIQGAIRAYAQNSGDEAALWILSGWVTYQADPVNNGYILRALHAHSIEKLSAVSLFSPRAFSDAEIDSFIGYSNIQFLTELLRGKHGPLYDSQKEKIEDHLYAVSKKFSDHEVLLSLINDQRNPALYKAIMDRTDVRLIRLMEKGDARKLLGELKKLPLEEQRSLWDYVNGNYPKIIGHISWQTAGRP